jgi:hypothetical protein
MNDTIRERCRLIYEAAGRLDKLLGGRSGEAALPDLDAAELLVGLDRLGHKLEKLAPSAEAALDREK